LAPDLERYFVMSAHDDPRGIGITMGVQPGGTVSWIGQIVAAIAALRIGATPSGMLMSGGVGFVVALAAHGGYARHTIAKAQSGYRPLFPTGEGSDPAT
jgi:hypothetical protein